MGTSLSVSREEVINRVRRIEGQLRGIERMLEDGRKCDEVIIQLTAVREAVNSTGALILEAEMLNCLLERAPEERPEAIKTTLQTLLRFAR